MAVFAILNRNASQAVLPVLQREFPTDHYHWSPNVLFVRGVSTAQEVSTRLGVRQSEEQDQRAGTLTQIAIIEASPNYWGYTDQALWTWLKASFEGSR